MGKIVIDSNDFLRGMSSSDFSQDGGFSPSYGGYNLDAYNTLLYNYPLTGLLCSRPPITARTGTTTDDVACFASGTDGLGEDFIMVDEDGHFYSLQTDGDITLGQTDATNTYNAYKSDAVYYSGSFYVTSTTDIALLSSSLSTLDVSWWNTTKARSSLNSLLPHPLLVFQDTLYIADGGEIFSWDGSSIATAIQLPNEYKVLAMEVHNGQIYLSVEKAINASGTYHGREFNILIWDGLSPTYSSEFTLPTKTFTIKSVNGRLYFFTKRFLGQWNGIGLTPIYYYGNNYSYVYKQFITTYQDRLFFLDQSGQIISYDGKKFYKLFKRENLDTFTDNTITGIFCGYNDTLILNGSQDNMYSMELDQYGDGGKWGTNRYNFDDKTWIRKVRISFQEETDTTTTTAFYYNDEENEGLTIGALSSETTKFKEFIVNKQVREFQLYVDFGTDPKPIKSIVIEYDKTN